MKKKVLVTGSSGYIGSHLCKWLQVDYDVYGIDRVPNKEVDRYLTKFWNHDVTEHGHCDMHFDAVVHLAALVRVGESVKKPTEYYRTNIVGTDNVITDVSCDNFILASTGAAAQPTSPYAYSKLAAEHIVRQRCPIHTIFRFYNVIGSAGFPPTNPDGLFSALIRAVETGEFGLYGNDYNTPDGTAIRDYVYILDICQAIQWAIERPSVISGAEVTPLWENLGHGAGHSVLEMVDIFKRENMVDFTVKVLPKRPGDVECSVLDDVSPYMREMVPFNELLRM